MRRDTPIRTWSPLAALIVLVGIAALAAGGAPLWSLIVLSLAGAGATAAAALADHRTQAARMAALESKAAATRSEFDAARTASARLSRLLESLDEPLLATDESGAVVLWNGAMERLVGLASAKALGRPLEEVFTHADISRIYAAAREGRVIREQAPIPRPDGPRVWEIAASPIGPETAWPDAPPGLRATVMTIRDVTEEARSMQIKTAFVANASHELRTPIASMRMALETLAGLSEDDEGGRAMRDRLMSMLSGNVARMEEMVRDLLDLSRLESPEAALRIEPAPISELARTLGDDFASVCRQRALRLVFDLDPALEAMRTDRKLLSLALANLIDNATKFAFEGTEIRVVGRPLPGENGGRGARLEVIDRGVGIPLNQQARVFERYYQVDQARDGGRVRRGTGLGLAIVKHAIRRLGGTVKVTSVWQQGTTMTVELPACLPSA